MRYSIFRQSEIPIRKRLTIRLVRNTLILVLFLGLLLVLGQILLDHKIQDENLDSTAKQILNMAKNAAAHALWNFDDAGGRDLTIGLLNYKAIKKVEIVDTKGRVLASVEQEVRTPLPRSARWLFGGYRDYSLDLFDPTGQSSTEYRGEWIGKINISLDTQIITVDFLKRATFILVSGLLMNLLLASLLLFIFHMIVGRPLLAVGDELATVDPQNPGGHRLQSPGHHRDDELGRLINNANDLLLAVAENIRRRELAENEFRKSEEQKLRLQTELECAAEIQRKLLPSNIPTVPGFEFAAHCLPARLVGGDFYDWHEKAPGIMTLTLGDVMGKGMAAAMLMATTRASLRTIAQGETPAVALQWAEKALRQDLDRSESFVTLFHSQLNLATRVLTYVDCGHGFAFLRRKDGGVEELQPRGLPLGVSSKEPFQEGSVCLEDGDALVLYSDGVIDAAPEMELNNTILAAQLVGASSAEEMVGCVLNLVPQDTLLPDDMTVLVAYCRHSLG